MHCGASSSWLIAHRFMLKQLFAHTDLLKVNHLSNH
ncbi:Uncharacterised protein [Legionella jordanis]|nr:Uncharacterised protein [Legionella jordanis]